jgi:hypothetical protein
MNYSVLATVIMALAIIAALFTILTIAYAQAPASSDSCPPGQVPVYDHGVKVIDPNTHHVECQPIDAAANVLGQ